MSIAKKLNTIKKNGIGNTMDAVIEGRKNHEANIPEVEKLAKERLKLASCLVDEPINRFKIKDERIPELSNKMCNDCGCAAPYLFRQNIKICKCWEK